MKITSGRIQRAGLNPNSGRSLGFYGVGALGQCINVDANGNCLDSTVPATGSVTSTTNVDTSALNAQQNLINAMTPAQYAAYQTQTTGAANIAAVYGTPTTAQPFQWGALLMGLGAMFFVVILVKKK